jgi:hypothetical protein
VSASDSIVQLNRVLSWVIPSLYAAVVLQVSMADRAKVKGWPVWALSQNG